MRYQPPCDDLAADYTALDEARAMLAGTTMMLPTLAHLRALDERYREFAAGVSRMLLTRASDPRGPEATINDCIAIARAVAERG